MGTRFTYTVTIDRDDVPGWNHEPDDFQRYLQKHLESDIGHYHPTVVFDGHSVTGTSDDHLLR